MLLIFFKSLVDVSPLVREGRLYCLNAFPGGSATADAFAGLVLSGDAFPGLAIGLEGFAGPTELDGFPGRTVGLDATNEECGGCQ